MHLVCGRVAGDRWIGQDIHLLYTPERTCKLVVATMLLHNICILHGLQLEQELFIETQEYDEVFPNDPVDK